MHGSVQPSRGHARRRVSFIATSDTIGGGERLTVEVATRLGEFADVEIVGRGSSPLLELAVERDIPVRHIDLGPKLGRRTAIQNVTRFPSARHRLHHVLTYEVRRQDWCVLQYKWEEILWAGRSVGRRILLWEHGPIPRPVTRLPVITHMLRSAFRRADAVLAWSAPAARSIAAFSGRYPARIDAGVDSSAIARARAQRAARRAWLLDGAARGMVIAYVGRLAPDKGLGVVIDALPFLSSTMLVIAGDGPARETLAAQARRQGVADRVRFLGHLDDPLATLAAADISVLLSHSHGEGRPLAAVEASALGTPVLGSAHSAALVALAGEGRAFLADDFSPRALAGRIAAVARGPRTESHTRDWSAVSQEVAHIMASVDKA
jgi:glycosyltransferase involved in cell wall biosynthesis